MSEYQMTRLLQTQMMPSLPSYNICEQYKPSWKPVTCDDVCLILTLSQIIRTAMAESHFAQHTVSNGDKAVASYSGRRRHQKLAQSAQF